MKTVLWSSSKLPTLRRYNYAIRIAGKMLKALFMKTLYKILNVPTFKNTFNLGKWTSESSTSTMSTPTNR